jgi:YidC/Oxa1 family membrane protein insertase
MKRKEYILIGVLLILIVLWPRIDRLVFKKYFPAPAAGVLSATNQPPVTSAPPAFAAAPARDTNLVEAAVTGATAAVTGTPAAVAGTPAAVAAPPAAPRGPEQTVLITNEHMAVTFSSYGASVKAVTLRDYRATIAKDSGPVILDFADRPALAYRDLAGLSGDAEFTLAADAGSRTVKFERRAETGVTLRRTVRLDDTYGLSVTDEFANAGGQAVPMPAHAIQLGPMVNDGDPNKKDPSGLQFLGVDTLSPGGETVQHWGSQLGKLFSKEQEEKGLPKLPPVVERSPRVKPVDWVAVKNKYFVQIFAPEGGGENSLVFAERQLDPREKDNPAFAPRFTAAHRIGAAMFLPEYSLDPGQSFVRNAQYYVGPKKYSDLRARMLHQVDVMEFRIGLPFNWMNPVINPCAKLLLQVLNALHDYLPPHSYGLAIILLTVLVRLVFWPVTHKSTQSMRRMAEVQPLVKALQEKYKGNPQKLQQEMMALYREHKINPLGGCLPMLIQIPVFMALFLVLRSAIELRFAPFLWIRDLSMPERIVEFGFTIPVIGWDALNLLPILMTATQFVQSKLTPTAGDPQQQRMMMVMMPLMMLFFLYNFASGLALYWTTQNILMIVQQVLTRRHQKLKKA